MRVGNFEIQIIGMILKILESSFDNYRFIENFHPATYDPFVLGTYKKPEFWDNCKHFLKKSLNNEK